MMELVPVNPALSIGRDSSQMALTKVQRWHPNFDPDPIYGEILHAVAGHRPTSDYSVIAHGSAIWGGRTVMRNGFPVSDVDILVIGLGQPGLITAARALYLVSKPFLIPEMPFFKLGVKFRTVEEITSNRITVNELGALRHGKLLCGRSEFEVYRPHPRWFHSQARLSVRTRIAYDAKQRERIRNDRFERPLSRYLAARVLLDIPTLALVTKGILGNDYTARVRQFLQMFESFPQMDPGSDKELAATLNEALRTKHDPENHQCGTVERAIVRLLDYTTRLGIGPIAPIDTTDKFWEQERPLDLRDQGIWREAAGG